MLAWSKRLKELCEFLIEPRWPAWELEECAIIDKQELISFPQIARDFRGINDIQTLLSADAIDQLEIRGRKRKARLSIMRQILPFIYVFAVLAGILSVTLIASTSTDFANPHWVTPRNMAMAGLIGFFVIFFLIAAIIRTSIRSHTRDPIENGRETLFVDPNSKAAQSLRELLLVLAREKLTPYACEADSKVRSISKDIYSADLFEAALLATKIRKAVSLSGDEPYGDFYFNKDAISAALSRSRSVSLGFVPDPLNSFLQKIDSETFDHKNVDAKIWIDKLETYPLQKTMLRNRNEMLSFLKCVSNHYAYNAIPGMRTLSLTQKCIVRAIIYLIENFVYWRHHLEDKRTPEYQKKLFGELIQIFAEAGRGPKTTLSKGSEAGSEAAERLMKGTYRPLEDWLKTLKD